MSEYPRFQKLTTGFYIKIPRILRTEYDTITAAQKWLYVCLKDLCGEKGTSFRSLRKLAKETGLSAAMLSTSIRTLHDVGLIHAEKKKRTDGEDEVGNVVWHITIVDIWKANDDTHPTRKYAKDKQASKKPNDGQQPDLQSMRYADYLQTDHWKEKRKKALRFANFKCQICNGSKDLNVHHRTYERLGNELLGDLTVLCVDCHAIFHKNGELAEE
jgi:hypothetical protein